MATEAERLLEQIRGQTPAQRLLAEIQAGAAPPAPQQPAETGPAPVTARQVIQQGAKGLLAGFSDEITAGFGASIAAVADGVPFGEAFKDILEAERAEIAQFEQERPVLSTALQIGGGLATGGLGATKVAGAKVFQGAALGQDR